MVDSRLASLWERLTPSARDALCKEAELLVEKQSGTLELHCVRGGVRALKVRPAGVEIRFTTKGGGS